MEILLLSKQNMGKGLHKIFQDVVNKISQALPNFGESGSGVSYFIPEPRKFEEVTRLSEDIKKPWLKATMKEYMYTATVKTSTKFYKTALPYDMIFTKDNSSARDEQFDNLTR